LARRRATPKDSDWADASSVFARARSSSLMSPSSKRRCTRRSASLRNCTVPQQHVEHRRQEQAEQRHAEHAGEHRDAHGWRISAPAPAEHRQHQRHRRRR
jgi:hypothetical protein